MAALEVDFVDEDTKGSSYVFVRQVGSPGFKIPVSWLSEFVEALDSPMNTETMYFWENYGVRKVKTACLIYVSTSATPLLQLSPEQCAKLSALIRTRYDLPSTRK